VRTHQITLNVSLPDSARFPGFTRGDESARIARLCREAAKDALEADSLGEVPEVSVCIEQQPEVVA
jgi:hypothetical protein